MIAQIKQAAGISDGEPAAAKIGKIETLVSLAADDLDEAVPIVASL